MDKLLDSGVIDAGQEAGSFLMALDAERNIVISMSTVITAG